MHPTPSEVVLSTILEISLQQIHSTPVGIIMQFPHEHLGEQTHTPCTGISTNSW